METKLAEEKALRLRAEASVQDKDREISMMSVDVRQLQYKYEKTDSELRQENEKNRSLVGINERIKEEKSLMQSDLSVQASENTLMKTNEKRLLRDLAEYRERNKSLEEELEKLKDPFNKEGLSQVETEKISQIQKEIDDKLKISYSNLNAWQKTQVARHEERPKANNSSQKRPPPSASYQEKGPKGMATPIDGPKGVAPQIGGTTVSNGHPSKKLELVGVETPLKKNLQGPTKEAVDAREKAQRERMGKYCVLVLLCFKYAQKK